MQGLANTPINVKGTVCKNHINGAVPNGKTHTLKTQCDKDNTGVKD